MRLVLLDLEESATAWPEGAFRLGFDHGGGRNLDWARPRRSRFELEQLLPRARKRLTEYAGTRIDRGGWLLEAAHGGDERSAALASFV